MMALLTLFVCSVDSLHEDRHNLLIEKSWCFICTAKLGESFAGHVGARAGLTRERAGLTRERAGRHVGAEHAGLTGERAGPLGVLLQHLLIVPNRVVLRRDDCCQTGMFEADLHIYISQLIRNFVTDVRGGKCLPRPKGLL